MATTDSNQEDMQSLDLIRQGGKMRDQGVSELHDKYAKKILYHVQKWSRWKISKAEAEEVVQEIFIKVILGCEGYKGDSTVKWWIFTIAFKSMTGHFRSKKLPTENLDDEGWKALEHTSEAIRTYDPELASDSLEDCVNKGFAEFAKVFDERAHVLSLVMEGFDTAYIADVIKRSPGATREYISQSRKRIEEFLRPCREYLSAV